MANTKSIKGLRILLKNEHGTDIISMFIGKKAFRGSDAKARQFRVCKWQDGLKDADIYRTFFEKLENQSYKTQDGRILKRDSHGLYYLAEPKVEEAKPEQKPVAQKPAPEVGEEPIADPKKAGGLVGLLVEYSDEYSFRDAKRGILKGLANSGKPFMVETPEGTVSAIFVRKSSKKYAPLRLAEAEVRRNLQGKWFYAKDGTHDFMVTSIRKGDNGWKVNGIASFQLLSDYIYADGSPAGELI